MNVKDRYAIDIYRLKPGTYDFEFPIDADFLALFTDSLIDKATGNVQLSLDKQESLIRATLTFDVDLPLVCDRSLRPFSHKMNEVHEVLFKFGEEEMEMDDDVYVITANTQRIHFEQFLYEWILLAVPMKKVHPDLLEEGDDDEDDVIIYQSESTGNEEESNEDSVDPRWEQLKKLKNK